MALIRRGLVKLDYLKRLGTKDSYKAKFEALAAAIDNAPAVDAEPVRHGHWVPVDYLDDPRIIAGVTAYKCSECGELEEDNGYMYCHCGARMYGGEIDAG